MRRSVLRAAAAAVPLCGAIFTASAYAGAFVSPGDLVAVQVNTTNSTGAGAVTLGEYAVAGSAAIGAPVNTVVLPSSGSSEFVENVGTDHDAQLELTENGNALVLAGYHDSAADTVAPGGQSATAVPREIAVINANGTTNTSTQFTNSFSALDVRSVASVDGNEFWVGGAGSSGPTSNDGIQYVSSLGATGASAVPLTPLLHYNGTTYTNSAGYDDVRGLNIYNGQLYGSTGSSSLGDHGVFTVGSGLPTTNGGGGQDVNFLDTDNSSGDQFLLLNLSGTTTGYGATSTFGGYDTLYDAASQHGLQKYSYIGGAWTPEGAIANANDLDLAATVTSNGVQLYVSTLTGIYELTDSSGAGGTLTGTPTLVLSAPAGTEFKGLAFAPAAVPEPASLLLVAAPAITMLRRRRQASAK